MSIGWSTRENTEFINRLTKEALEEALELIHDEKRYMPRGAANSFEKGRSGLLPEFDPEGWFTVNTYIRACEVLLSLIDSPSYAIPSDPLFYVIHHALEFKAHTDQESFDEAPGMWLTKESPELSYLADSEWDEDDDGDNAEYVEELVSDNLKVFERLLDMFFWDADYEMLRNIRIARTSDPFLVPEPRD